jgi:hypothetical protein
MICFNGFISAQGRSERPELITQVSSFPFADEVPEEVPEKVPVLRIRYLRWPLVSYLESTFPSLIYEMVIRCAT